jgi:hypothetical protein
MTRASRYVAGATAAAALTVSLAGCKTADSGAPSASGTPNGGGVHLTAAQEALSKAAQQTGDVKSFRATLSSSTVVSGRQTKLKGDLAVQVKPSPAMKLNLPAIDAAGKRTAGMEEILIGDDLYLKIPALTQQAGKPWTKVSLSKVGAAAGIDIENLQNQGSQANPALNAKLLTASKDVHAVGKEKVDGDSTTHYQGTFSLADAVAKLESEQRAQAQKLFGQAGLDKLVFNVWIAKDQLPRKLSLTTPPGSKLKTDTTLNYVDYNKPVSITPPPASQVSDSAGLPTASPSTSPSTPG